ncbi:Uma2 family endonuclease [Kitasatospora sp. NPDC004531]
MDAATADWRFPPSTGWTYDQVKDSDWPFEFELVDGGFAIRGRTGQWHDTVRDELFFALHRACQGAYEAGIRRCVLVDPHNAPKPDAIVFDRTGLDFFTMERVPVTAVKLAVEVVSHGSRSDDRFRKPGMYAEAGVPYFWRVERGEDGSPVVYEFHLDEETGVYAPAPGVAVHHGKLITELPFRIELDLTRIVPR